MARRRSKRPVVPGAQQSLDLLKAQVMRDKGYAVQTDQPESVKYAVAQSRGIPLQKGYNGNLRAEDAGKIGGPIGGAMVREMIRMAQEQLAQSHSNASR